MIYFLISKYWLRPTNEKIQFANNFFKFLNILFYRHKNAVRWINYLNIVFFRTKENHLISIFKLLYMKNHLQRLLPRTIVLSFCLVAGTVSGQERRLIDRIVPVSPEAGDLGKYINYPVSYSTGLVNIEIPLYEVRAGDLVLPITLSYHASGLKVKEEDGWIGLGWSLHAEPSVSRSINGLRDEAGYLVNPYFGSGITNKLYLIQLANGAYDEEPDDFYYRLSGKSGGFHLSRLAGSGYTAIPHPWEPVSINCNLPGNIEITDENGVYYRFDSGVETTDGQPTQWKASEMKSGIGGHTISFSYHDRIIRYAPQLTDYLTVEHEGDHNTTVLSGIYNCPSLPDFVVMSVTDMQKKLHSFSPDGTIQQVICDSYGSTIPGAVGMMEKALLQEISFPQGNIRFFLQGEYLDRIEVQNNGALIRKITFHRSPYAGSEGRMKLDSIAFKDRNGISVSRYEFGYNGSLPPRTSKDIDHWGYYNAAGNDPTKSTVPRQKYPIRRSMSPGGEWIYYVYVGDANREPSATAVQQGILRSITYPTGGKTMFTYEGNRARWSSGAITLEGGLRIKEVVDYDPATDKSVRRYYKYGESEDGTGFAKRKVTPETYMHEQNNHYEHLGFITIDTLHTYTSNARPDLFYSDGSPVFYTQVTEYREGYGKTVYRYPAKERKPDYFPYTPGMPLEPDPRNDWKYDYLSSKEEYKLENGSYKLVSREAYEYTRMNESTINVGKTYRYRNVIEIPRTSTPLERYEDIEYLQYSIQTGCIRPSMVVRSSYYDPGGSVTEEKQYEYNSRGLVKEERSFDSRGLARKTVNQYPFDVNGGVYRAMVVKNQINTVIESVSQVDGLFVSGRLIPHRLENGYYLPDKTFSYHSQTPFSSFTYYDGVNRDTHYGNTPDISTDRYGSKGNILQTTERDGTVTSWCWDSGDILLLGKFENITYENILSNTALTGYLSQLQSFITFDSPSERTRLKTLNQNIRNLLPAGASGTTYTHQPLVGLTSWTDPNGLVTFYGHDPDWRLAHIRNDDGDIREHYDYHYGEAPGPMLSVTPAGLAMSSGGGMQSVSVNSNVAWNVTSNQSWITVSQDFGAGNGTVSVMCASNASSYQRSGMVIISGGGVTRTVTVNQQASSVSPSIVVSPASLTFPWNGSPQYLSVSSNVPWTAAANQTWISVNPSSGSGNGTVTVTCTRNGGSLRRGTVTISGGGITRTIQVEQGSPY